MIPTRRAPVARSSGGAPARAAAGGREARFAAQRRRRDKCGEPGHADRGRVQCPYQRSNLDHDGGEHRCNKTQTVARSSVGPVKLKLDLHDIFNRNQDIERALRSIIDEAIQKKATLVEIIPGKGSGQLKKRVLRFLEQRDVKALYHRIEKDSHNFGRVFVHFRWK
jgi:DNA-nicking Smr family endonuclease